MRKRLGTIVAVVLLAAISAACTGAGAGTNDSNAVLTSINVTPADASISNRLTKQFTATGTFSDGTTQDLTRLVKWNSSSRHIASFGKAGTGLVTATACGSTTITATLGDIVGKTTLSIAPPVTAERS